VSFRRPFPFAAVGCVAITLACSVACGSSDSGLFGNHGGLDAALPAFSGWGGTSSNGGAPGSGSVTSNGGSNGGGGLAASGGAGIGGTSSFGGAIGSGGSAIEGGSGGSATEAGAGGADGGGNPEAGSGGNAGSGGAIGSGGKGGSAGAIGSGGAASGGKGGSAGVAGSGGVAGGGGAIGSGGAAGNPSAGFVRCGDGSCDKSKGLVCCVKTVGQKTTATCVKDTSTCDNVFACDGNSDCKAGTQCCLDYTNTQTTVSPDTACLTTCNNGGPFQCSGPADCPGRECCGTGIALSLIGTYYTSVVCQNSCASTSTGMAAYELCDSSTVCAQTTTCQQSASFPPGYRVCK
jgi:hypothetical protein